LNNNLKTYKTIKNLFRTEGLSKLIILSKIIIFSIIFSTPRKKNIIVAYPYRNYLINFGFLSNLIEHDRADYSLSHMKEEKFGSAYNKKEIVGPIIFYSI